MTVVLFGAMMTPGFAESYESDPGDAPEHGVARISLISGDVTVRRGDSGEFVAADLNTPLVELDHVLTEDNGRTEIQLDWSHLLRLAPESEVRLSELRDRDFLVQIAVGTVTLRVRRGSDSQIELSMPTASFRPTDEGTYRITVRDDYSTEITVRSGEGEVYVGGDKDFLREGQTLLVRGDPADPQRAYRNALPRDDWDRWNEDRDHELDRSDAYKYVSRDIYGAEDLSSHGRWVYDPPYGWVWVPHVDSGWAPYRVGRWSWVNYYGWTWISGDPWGWAPYHYGRWYHAPRYGWVWYPGVTTVRYTWQPALVAFFGWGVNLGWVPLAPYEVYRPWYGAGRTVAVNNVTVVNNINVVNTYRNARFISGHSGVTSVVSKDFGRRRVTVNNYVAGNDRDYSRAGDAGRWLPRESSRESRQFSDRSVPARNAARRDVDRPFVTRPDRPAKGPKENRNDRNDRNDPGNRDNGNRSRAGVGTEPKDSRQPASSPTGNSRRADAPGGNARKNDGNARDSADRSQPRVEPKESRPPAVASNANGRRTEARGGDARNDRSDAAAAPRVEPKASRPPAAASNGNARRAEPRDEAKESRPPSTASNANARRVEPRGGDARNDRNDAAASARSQTALPPSENSRPRRTESEAVPRSESPRSRAPENSRANEPVAAAARREVEPPRQREAARPEPSRGGQARVRSEEAAGPQGSRSPSAGEGRPAGPSRSTPAPVVRGEGRSPGSSEPPTPPVVRGEGRAAAPSSEQENSGGNGNGRGRGR